MLSDEVIDSAGRSVLCWLATSDADGMPNVSPKEIFTPWGESQILIANIASPGSVRNIEMNNKVCLCFVDVFVQKGFKLKGRARNVMPTHQDFRALLTPLESMTQGRFVIRSIILMNVTSLEPVWAPSYQFYGHEVSEATQRASAMTAYGVQPL
jgi:predicted pyridoxine 5'-phosphate oxidase superfamily flavin-nucleotide-binding protein